MPVMTSACGIGSPPNPAAAPRRATTPNSREHAGAKQVKRDHLRSGCGSRSARTDPDPPRTALHRPYSVAEFIRCRSRCGGPATSKASIAAIDSVTGSSIVDNQQFGMIGRIGKEGARHRKSGEPDRKENRRPSRQAQGATNACRSAARRRGPPSLPKSTSRRGPLHSGIRPRAQSSRPKTNGCRRESRPAAADGQRNENASSGSSRWRKCPGRPPQKRSGASDQTPSNASSSTTPSSSVSIARYAIRTAVTGLPRPVSARFAAASGAKRRRGLGNSSTIAASPAVTRSAT